MSTKKTFRDILKNHSYLCLATADKNAIPWATPIAYVCDDDFSLYFISHTGSLHAKNIQENPHIALSIYDSNQPLRHAFGIQADGQAEAVDEWHVPSGVRQELFEMVSLAVLAKEYSFYRIKLGNVYVPDAERWKEFHHLRTKIEL